MSDYRQSCGSSNGTYFIEHKVTCVIWIDPDFRQDLGRNAFVAGIGLDAFIIRDDDGPCMSKDQ